MASEWVLSVGIYNVQIIIRQLFNNIVSCYRNIIILYTYIL